MKNPNTFYKTLLAIALMIGISCTPNKQESLSSESSLTFENIEIGTSLEDSRMKLNAKYDEHKIGQQPDLVVFQFEDGRQLAFTGGELTDKNSAEAIEDVKVSREE